MNVARLVTHGICVRTLAGYHSYIHGRAWSCSGDGHGLVITMLMFKVTVYFVFFAHSDSLLNTPKTLLYCFVQFWNHCTLPDCRGASCKLSHANTLCVCVCVAMRSLCREERRCCGPNSIVCAYGNLQSDTSVQALFVDVSPRICFYFLYVCTLSFIVFFEHLQVSSGRLRVGRGQGTLRGVRPHANGQCKQGEHASNWCLSMVFDLQQCLRHVPGSPSHCENALGRHIAIQ